MGRKKLSEKEKLTCKVESRITLKKFNELQKLLGNVPNRDMSGLIRDILNNRPVTVFTYDRSLDMVMQELAAHRSQIKAIGVNINQITRFFNTYPEENRKEFYAKTAFHRYQALQPLIQNILLIITKLSKKWLSE